MSDNHGPSNYLYIDLATLQDGKPFDGLAAGKYTDMYGHEVEFGESDLQSYVDNTLDGITGTITESGEIVGLPIDARGHDKGDGAGWIIDAALDSGGKKVKLTPRWTEIGRELIEKGIRRFFSATVDIKNKVILGGTLTNWPATRDGMGKIMLRPIELSQQLQAVEIQPAPDTEPANEEIDPPGDEEEQLTNLNKGVDHMDEHVVTFDDLTDEQKAELLNQAREAIKSELPEPVQPVDLEAARKAMMGEYQAALEAEYKRMQSQAGQMLAEMIAKFEKERHIAEFAQRVTGGEERGLPVTAEEIERVLSSLDDATRSELERIFDVTVKRGLIDFREIGHGKNPEGTRELSEPYASILKSWLRDGNELEEFFVVNPEIGPMSEYNLKAYRGEEK